MALERTSRRAGRGGGISGKDGIAGWLFVAPSVVLLGVFLLAPILMALWVAFSDWSGRGSPFSGNVNFVGTENFSKILSDPGLARTDFGTSIRNNIYYVLLVIPIQTALSLVLAVLVNRRILKGRGFFRTAFYFPSVTSSVAITVIFTFLFSATGAVNAALKALSIDGPLWFSDPRGLIHVILANLGVTEPPAALANNDVLGVSLWNWLSGPSAAMSVFIIMAVFTTSGTFMLLYLSALQNIQGEIEEAALIDGTSGWQRLRYITIPMLKPTTFTVMTLGLIGTWQVFDQIYTGSQGAPAKTTLTPAYLSYQASFINGQWGQGAAIAFILFVIIVLMTIVQRIVMRERALPPRRKRFYPDGIPGGTR